MLEFRWFLGELFHFSVRSFKFANLCTKTRPLCEIVGAADPVESSLNKMRRDHGLKDGQMFKDWREVAALDKKLADIAMICVQVKSGDVKMKIGHLPL